jgi:hypothetical protein
MAPGEQRVVEAGQGGGVRRREQLLRMRVAEVQARVQQLLHLQEGGRRQHRHHVAAL